MAAGEIHLLGAPGRVRTDGQETGGICHEAPNQDLVSPSFPGASGVKHTPANAGDSGSIPGPGRSHALWASRPVLCNESSHHNAKPADRT